MFGFALVPGEHGGEPFAVGRRKSEQRSGQLVEPVALGGPFALVLRPASGVSALSFSGSLVQTLVQTGGSVGVSPCGLSLTTVSLLLPKLDVAGSSPVSRSERKYCRILELGYLPASGSAA